VTRDKLERYARPLSVSASEPTRGLDRSIELTASEQTGQNPVSASGNVGQKNESAKSKSRKDKNKEHKEYLKALEADAQSFVKGFHTVKTLDDQAKILHRRFDDLVREMRPVLERVRFGFAHLKKGETVMGERTGPAWAKKYIGLSYDWLCRRLSEANAGTLPPTNGTNAVTPSAANTERNQNIQLPRLKQTLPTIPSADNPDWTDNEYIKACVRFFKSTLGPLKSDSQRFRRVVLAIAREIRRETENPGGGTAS